MSLESNLREMELSREGYWRRYPKTAPIKLRWRARCARHCLHIQPGETILEIGAGSGLWTAHLTKALRGENPITALVFNEEFLDATAALELPQTNFLHVETLDQLPAESFDYIVGTAILCHDKYAENLEALYRLLKPGGQLLFFEANYWNPQVFLKNNVRLLGQWTGEAECQVGMRKYQLMKQASHQGFIHIEVIPYDILHPRTPRWLIKFVQSTAFVLEHAPLVREICGTLNIWLVKPGKSQRRAVYLAHHRQLFDSVSVVIPCHNEEMNVQKIVKGLIDTYDQYIHEIIIVNDNSRDRTSEVTRELMRHEPRIKLIDRLPPNGVGRALRDGYESATGRYILSMDCDFLLILPELRDLFDAVAAGRDGAIGSRFSYDSVLINYPFLKIICNRSFHLLLNLMLPTTARDVSNNLKLYRAEILKQLDIEEPHFAANMETGLKPLLAGYDIEEVPISWINRTVDMGQSSFNVVKVAPNYFGALMRTIWKVWRGRRQFRRSLGPEEQPQLMKHGKLPEKES
jgi:glycosyltransferase involved in cell wall biosynthesis/protein-L-isoaspartate O-methyltransferase